MFQFVITLVIGIGFAMAQGVPAAFAALFGGGSAMVLTGLLAIKMYRLAQRLQENKMVASPMLALGFVPRLILVLGLFWIGLWLMELAPIPMVVGFALAHLGYLLNFYKLRHQHCE